VVVVVEMVVMYGGRLGVLVVVVLVPAINVFLIS
jgi:hypothetical protein